jgi:hypothetical protein
LVEEIKVHFERYYMEDWLSYFASARNKKEIWTLGRKQGLKAIACHLFMTITEGQAWRITLEGEQVRIIC